MAGVATRTSWAPTAIGIEKLSDREMHIFHLLGSGLGNTQIAHSLHLSVKTIESHRENIKRKLDMSCSRDLVACAKKYIEETFLPAAKGANEHEFPFMDRI